MNTVENFYTCARFLLLMLAKFTAGIIKIPVKTDTYDNSTISGIELAYP
jgi:hypothetical protein